MNNTLKNQIEQILIDDSEVAGLLLYELLRQ